MPLNAATVGSLTLLGTSLLPLCLSFVRAPSPLAPQGQGPCSSRLSTPLPSAQHRHQRPPPCFTVRERACGARRITHGLSPLSVGGSDGYQDIDPLEMGADIDPLLAGPDETEMSVAESDEAASGVAKRPAEIRVSEDAEMSSQDPNEAIAAIEAPVVVKKRRGRPAKAGVSEDSSDEVVMAALAKKKKKPKRRKRSPFIPKDTPDFDCWVEKSPSMEIGCRVHVSIFHRNIPEDIAKATEFLARVKERYGKLVNVVQVHDDRGVMTEEEIMKSNAFEIWLDGMEPVVYHSRGESRLELTEDLAIEILDDIGLRVHDDASRWLYSDYIRPQFEMRGIEGRTQVKRMQKEM